jgi:hypothetical protein
MKTQLLEDIGQSAELSLAPAFAGGQPQAGKGEPRLAAASKAWSTQRRAGGGVWRQKPAEEPLVLAAPEPALTAAPELREVFEEIAALEAQFVHPLPEPEPAGPPAQVPYLPPAASAEPAPDAFLAPAETTLVRDPTHTAAAPHDPLFDFTLPLPASPAEHQHEPVVRPPAEATLDWTPASAAAARRDPLFDFTPPTTPLPATDPFTPAGAGRERSPRRYLLWAVYLLAGGLLVQGGRWLYQERADAGSLALVAGQAQQIAAVDQAATRQAVAAAESTSAPAADTRAVLPAAAASTPSSGVPPLVMLKPEEYAPRKDAQPSPGVKGREEVPPKPKQETKPRPQPKPEPEPKLKSEPKPEPESKPKSESKPKPIAKQGSASPLPKPVARKAQAPSQIAAAPAKEKRKREPVRQIARAAVIAPERPAEPDTSMDALLKACRAHGYHASQCIKRGCSVTQYGFACRGR